MSNMNNMGDIERLVDGLEVAMRANVAFERLIGHISSVFQKCSLVRSLGLLDDLAVLDAINEIDVCIIASGRDSRVIELCRYALELAHVGENEIRITLEGNVVRRMVYFARNGRGLIKIGSSMNVAERLRGLETGAGEPLHLILSAPGSTGAERQLHQKFSCLHEHGEWFRAEPALTDYIKDLQLTLGLDAA